MYNEGFEYQAYSFMFYSYQLEKKKKVFVSIYASSVLIYNVLQECVAFNVSEISWLGRVKTVQSYNPIPLMSFQKICKNDTILPFFMFWFIESCITLEISSWISNLTRLPWCVCPYTEPLKNQALFYFCMEK